MKDLIKKRIPMILLFLCGLSYSQMMHAQKSISGSVTDNQGLPIIGVNIHIVGTTQGTMTDVDGKFKLMVPSDSTKLQFTFVGYLSETIKVDNKTQISIVLEEDLVNISEIVVVGYGSMRKSDLTGSISSIKADQIENIPVRSATDALQGKIAGVSITSTSGSPGSLPVVHIRGTASVNGTDPIYVVDGFPQGDISWLNDNDIESMEVLKDASACAIYGSRGTNGVVMVTTKKGPIEEDHKMNINLNVLYGIQSLVKTYDMMNAEEYLDYKILANQNGGSEWAYASHKDEILNFLTDNFGSNKGTDWQDEIFQKATIKSYNLSLSNGTSNSAYYSSLSYFNQDGVVKGADFKRISWNNNITNRLTRYARLNTSLFLVSQQRHNVAEDDINVGTIYSAMGADPITPVYRTNLHDIPDAISDLFYLNKLDVTNAYSFYSPVLFNNKVNPVAQSDIMHQSVWKDLTLRGNVTAEIDLTSWLQYKGSVHVSFYRANPEYFVPKYYIGPYQNDEEGYVGAASYTSNYYVIDNYLTVDKKYELLGKSQHTVFMVGISTEQSKDNSFSAFKHGLVTNEQTQRIIDAATTTNSVGGSKGESTMQSYFGRVFHSWNDRYLFTANLRYDGSSNFSSMHKWAFFPSASFAYVFSEEDFMQFLKSISMSTGKLRASWGEVGNQAISAGSFLTQYSLNDGYYLYGNSSQPSYLLSGGRSYIGNPDVKWETSEQVDLGLDLGFFSNKMTFTFDYYNKKTKDMLLSIPLPVFLGYPDDPIQNAGTIKNWGLEFSLDYREKLGEVGFEISGNLTTNKNEVVSLGDGLPIISGYYSPNINGFTKTEEGKPIGYFYGYKANGIFQSQTEIDTYTNAEGNHVTQEGARPGDLRYVDVNKDGEITAGDYTDIGNPTPDLTYGINLSVDYKGFDLNASFYGVAGNQVMNVKKIDFYSGTAYYNAPKDLMTKAWTETNPSNSQFKITTDPANNLTVSSWLVEDASFLRLQNLQLGYTFPQKLTKSLKMENCRFWVGAINLFTITNYSGMSPEVGSSDPTASGIDIAFYPQSRQFLMGFNVQF
jgi:TonB-dependent starch-binding outer membrane protein SusC